MLGLLGWGTSRIDFLQINGDHLNIFIIMSKLLLYRGFSCDVILRQFCKSSDSGLPENLTLCKTISSLDPIFEKDSYSWELVKRYNLSKGTTTGVESCYTELLHYRFTSDSRLHCH